MNKAEEFLDKTNEAAVMSVPLRVGVVNTPFGTSLTLDFTKLHDLVTPNFGQRLRNCLNRGKYKIGRGELVLDIED